MQKIKLEIKFTAYKKLIYMQIRKKRHRKISCRRSQCSNFFEVGKAIGIASKIDLLPFLTFQHELQLEIVCQDFVFFSR